MMRKTTFSILMLAGLLALGGSLARAQNDDTKESSSKRDANGNPVAPDPRVDAAVSSADSADSAPAADTKSPARYVAALNSDRLIQLGGGRNFNFLYSSTFTEAWDDHLGGAGRGLDGTLTLVNPTLGFTGHSQKLDYLFQYSPTISALDRFHPGVSAFHQSNLMLTGQFNHGWGWDFAEANSYGVDQLRLLSGLSFGVVGGTVSGANAGQAVLQLGNRDILNESGTVGLHWQPSERTRIAGSVGYTYYSILSSSSHASVGSYRLSFERAVTRKTTFNVFTDGGRYFDKPVSGCIYYGGGAGVLWRPTQRITMNAEGGPSWSTAQCSSQRGGQGSGGLAVILSPFSTFYVQGGRQLYAPVQFPHSETVDTLSLGYARQFRRKTTFRLDAGYARLTDSFVTPTVSLNGYFVSPQVGWQFSRSITASLNYRHMYQIVGLTNLNRNQALFIIEWRPAPKGLYK